MRFADALAEAGVEVDLETYDGADHMWLGSPGAAEQAFERTIEFLQRQVGF